MEQLLFTLLYLIVINNARVAAHFESCSRWHNSHYSCCIIVVDDTTVAVHAALSCCFRWCNIFYSHWILFWRTQLSLFTLLYQCCGSCSGCCSCCILLMQTKQPFPLASYFIVHIVCCSRRRSSCCSHCIFWPATLECRTRCMMRSSQLSLSIPHHSRHRTSTACPTSEPAWRRVPGKMVWPVSSSLLLILPQSLHEGEYQVRLVWPVSSSLVLILPQSLHEGEYQVRWCGQFHPAFS